MTAERVDPFATIERHDLPRFEPKPRSAKPVDLRSIDKLAAEENFPSRQAPATPAAATEAPRRAPRLHRTGRSQQLNIKAKPEVVERAYQLAETRGVSMCEMLEQAIAALEAETRAGR